MDEWLKYKKAGGTLTYTEWLKQGRPEPPTGMPQPTTTTPGTPGAKPMIPDTAQEMIPDELFYDAPTKTWYGVGPDNTAYPVDPALGEMKYAAYRARYQPRQAPSLTFPGQPSPYEGVSAEELPEWEPGFYKAAFERARSPVYQGGRISPYAVTTLADGSTGYLNESGQWVEMTSATKRVTERKPAPGGAQFKYDAQGRESIWNPETGRYEETGGYDPTKDTTRGMTEAEKARLGLEERRLTTEQEQYAQTLAWQQAQGLRQERLAKEQRLAELAARPINWLQYAAETKTPPVVQPWMMPLSQEQYGWKVGEPIPGVSWGTRAQTVGQEPQFFSEEERQRYANAPTTPAPAGQDWRFFAGQWQLRNKEGAMAGSETLPTTATGMNFQNLPELLRPGAQLWARMGPTAQQQLYGYQQAQSGISPEESEFRRQSTLPPGGRAPRWVWSR